MLSQWVYETFGENAAKWVQEFAIFGTPQNTIMRIAIVVVPLIIKTAITILIIVFLIKGIKYLSKKNKDNNPH